MSLLSGSTSSSSNKKLMGYFPQSSIHNVCIPVVYGTMRVTGNIINTFGWFSQAASSGGKGGGKGSSGKGGGNYDYWTGFLSGICLGPIGGVATIWLDRTIYKPFTAIETITVPGSGIYAAANPGFFLNTGVQSFATFSTTVDDYGSPGSATFSGTQAIPLIEVPSSPALGQYSVDSLGNYTFNSGDIGVLVQISYQFAARGGLAIAPPVTKLNFTLFLGTAGQAAWSYATPGLVPLGYTQLAYVAIEQFPLSTSGMIPNFSFEVVGKLLFPGAGIVDCDPISIFADFIQNSAYGANWNPALLGSLTEASTWCVANGIFCSALYDSQRTAATWLAELLTIANAEAVWSDATLKLRSRGDTTAVGNGVTFTPTTQPIYDLDDDDFIAKPGDEPIEFDLPTAQDSYNSLKVEWTNRGNGYQTEPAPAQDDYAIALYGIREASQVSLHGITEHIVAAKTAQIQLKRLVYERGTAKFTLGTHYCLLEPMDMVTLTDPGLGFVKQPFRIISIDEDDQGNLAITAIIFPWSISQPTLHPKQTTGGYLPAYSAQPGSVNAPIFFEAPQEMTQQIGLVIFIMLAGGPSWGGCSVYESSDGTTYDFIARHTSRSASGVTTATLPYSSDPDTTGTLAVNLVSSIGELESFSQAQADKFQSLALVDQELVAYTTATLTTGYKYNLTGYLRRGLFGTTAAQHSSGSRFAVIDGTEFEDMYQTTDIGKIRWYKFTSFNLAGQQEENLASVTAYPWSILAPYTHKPFPWKSFGQGTFTDASSRPSGYAPVLSISGPNLQLQGYPPVNVFSQAISQPPVIDNAATVTSNGSGTVPIGKWVLQVFPIDSLGLYGPPSTLSTFTTTVATEQVAFAIALPAGTVQYQIFAGPDIDSLLSNGAPVTATPSTITLLAFNVPFFQGEANAGDGGYGPPDSQFDHFHVRAKREILYGAVGANVLSVSTATIGFSTYTTGLKIGLAPGVTLTAGQFNGYILSNLGRASGSNDYQDIVISTSAADGTLTFATLSVPGTPFSPGDFVSIRLIADIASADTIGCSQLVNNAFAGGLGLTTDAMAGYEARTTIGTGAGQTRDIVSNTSTTLTVAEPWTTIPDSTTGWIITEKAWPVDQPTSYVAALNYPLTPDPNPPVIASVPITQLAGSVIYVEAIPQDVDSRDALETLDEYREILVPLSLSQSIGVTYYQIAIAGGVAEINVVANGSPQLLILPADGSQVTCTLAGTVPSAGAPLKLFIQTPGGSAWSSSATYAAGAVALGSDGKAYSSLAGGNLNNDPVADVSRTYWGPPDNWSTPAFTGGPNGFDGDMASGSIYVTSAVANKRDSLSFTFHGAGTTVSLDAAPRIGGAIS